jgi:hypothetical protein
MLRDSLKKATTVVFIVAIFRGEYTYNERRRSIEYVLSSGKPLTLNNFSNVSLIVMNSIHFATPWRVLNSSTAITRFTEMV